MVSVVMRASVAGVGSVSETGMVYCWAVAEGRGIEPHAATHPVFETGTVPNEIMPSGETIARPGVCASGLCFLSLGVFYHTNVIWMFRELGFAVCCLVGCGRGCARLVVLFRVVGGLVAVEVAHQFIEGQLRSVE